MASGIITSGSGLEGRTYRINWSSVIDIAGNYSEITCEHYLVNDPTYSLYIGSRGNTCTVDGAAVSYTSGAISTGGSTTHHLGTTKHVVWHQADGGKQVKITGTFRIQATLSGRYVDSVTAEGLVTLDTIPRSAVPTLSVSSVTMHDGSVWISTNGLTDTFDYVLTYSFGTATGTISDHAGAGVSWSPGLELAAQIPNSDRGSGLITCQTWSKDRRTQIGSNCVPVELVVPGWVGPSVSASCTDTTQASELFGSLVQNVSKVEVSSTVTLAYGSPIKSTALTLDGAVYTGGVIRKSGSIPLVLTVTDSRGRTGQWRQTINVLGYQSPNVILSAHRCDADGTPNDLGEYAQIAVDGSVASMNGKNTLRLTVEHGNERKQADTLPASWIVAAPSTDTLNITATLSDRLCGTVRNMVLSTGYATMDLLKGGKGISFGKSATREGFDCDMYAYLNAGTQTPHINGVYIKKVHLEETPYLNIQGHYSPIAEGGTSRQSFFIFGMANFNPVQGVAMAHSGGKFGWYGTDTAYAAGLSEDGVLTIRFADNVWGDMIIMSNLPFTPG